MGALVYGCDICQDVCPWNRRAAVSDAPEWAPRAGLDDPELSSLWRLSDDELERLIEGTPMVRAGVARLRRNLAIAIGNAAGLVPARVLDDDADALRPSLADPVVRECVQWARQRLAGTDDRAVAALTEVLSIAMPDQPTLAPSLLLSMPQLDDPNFTRSVVLLCQHDADGAFGLVLNRPITTTARIVPQADPELATEQEVDVWIGGPVEPERSWILLSDSTLDEKAIRVCDGIYLSTSARVLEGVLQTPDQSRARLIAGYAGWGPGQLDEEVVASAWLTGDIDLDIVFQTPAPEMWERAIRRLGADPGSLQLGSGVH